MGWDADDNGDGHLDAPADDPRNPPAQEGEPMGWHVTPRQLPRTGMWQAEAVSDSGYRQVSSLWATKAQAETEVWALVDNYERAIGVRS